MGTIEEITKKYSKYTGTHEHHPPPTHIHLHAQRIGRARI